MTAAIGRFDGRHALITGGANGLGYAAAARLAAAGATIGIIDFKQESVDQAIGRLREGGAQVVGYTADVTDVEAIQQAVTDFHARNGAIDVLVTMAGIYFWVEFADMTPQQWHHVIDTNLGGTFVCTHAAMPFMKEQGYGRIVTVSSGTVLIGTPGQSAYIASKAGVIGLTRALAREGGPFGVTANCVLPGLIATEQVLRMSVDVDGFFDSVIADQCIQRRGEPADVAEAVAFLAGEGSEFVTGQSLSVGGGDRFL